MEGDVAELGELGDKGAFHPASEQGRAAGASRDFDRDRRIVAGYALVHSAVGERVETHELRRGCVLEGSVGCERQRAVAHVANELRDGRRRKVLPERVLVVVEHSRRVHHEAIARRERVEVIDSRRRLSAEGVSRPNTKIFTNTKQ